MKVAFKSHGWHGWFTAIVGVILMACTFLVQAKTVTESATSPTMLVADLPREGQATYQRIRQGGPFPYEKDGVVFGNRERQLPRQARGYYREYTVKTPGSRDRGARRIVCGGQEPRNPQACYYTQDHYASFREIVAQN
ncbi:MAG: ribonuclease domain-containing protein [Limnohabitans sp.]